MKMRMSLTAREEVSVRIMVALIEALGYQILEKGISMQAIAEEAADGTQALSKELAKYD